MSDARRQEMAEKRARLEELRRAKAERMASLAQAESAGVATGTASSSRQNIDALVDNLLGQRATSPLPPVSRGTPVPSSQLPSRGPSRTEGASAGVPRADSMTASANGAGRTTPGVSIPGTPGGRTSRASNDGAGRVSAGVGPGMAGIDRILTPSEFASGSVDYIDHSSELYELPSKAAKPPPVTYSKATQTASASVGTSPQDSDDDDATKLATSSGRETEEEMRTRILEELEAERKALEKDLQDLKEREERVSGASPACRLGPSRIHLANGSQRDLSQEQRQAIFSAPDFSAFIEESTKIVQRALSDGYDYIKDYTIGLDGALCVFEVPLLEITERSDDAEGSRVKLLCAFSDERWTAGRSVTDLDWSSQFPELVVASYNKDPSSPNDPDGIVAVWNLHLQERPEFIFHSPSDVLSVTFSPFHPTLVFGGSYSGQVLLWDTRAKHLPVLKTPLSAAGHTYPIYGMKMVGTTNANNLMSSSTDGLVCSWLADMLAQPQEALPLTAPSHTKTDEVSITCLDFPHSDTATFWIGTEEGSIYQAHRYDRAASKAGLDLHEIYRGHAGPVTGIHFHPGTGAIDFSDLFLSSSVDWTVKLWRAKTASVTKAAGGAPSDRKADIVGGEKGMVAPIHSFEESDDYVFDVKWHTNHPAVFGSVDGSGKFDLWNLNTDVEVSERALNKLAWDRSPLSRKVGIGGSDGGLYVYDVAEKVVSPRDAEWTDLQKTVQGLALRDAGLGVPAEPSRGR